MTDLMLAFPQFGRLYPTPASHPGGGDTDWEGDCARFVYRFLQFVNGRTPATHGDISSAWAAALNSGTLDPDPMTAKPGHQHFWRQRYVNTGKPGHTSTELGGHVTGMASAYCTTYVPGTKHLGYATVAEYNARRADNGGPLEYVGHAANYAGAVIDATGTASLSESPLNNQEDDEMTYSLVPDAGTATIWVVSHETGLRVGLASMYHLSLLQRLKNNALSYNDPMLPGEIDICHQYLSAINPAPSVVASPAPAIDVPAFAKVLGPLLQFPSKVTLSGSIAA